MILSKRQQRIEDKFLKENKLKRTAKVVVKVKNILTHLNSNLRPTHPFINKPVSRAHTPELFDKNQDVVAYTHKFGTSRRDRRRSSKFSNDIHQIVPAKSTTNYVQGSMTVIIPAQPRKIVHHNPIPIKLARLGIITLGKN